MRAVIIHGWGGTPEGGWKPWLREKLRAEGFEVLAPQLPDTEHPKMDAWLEKLRETIGEPSEDLYLVGHSLGCITILRYLESINVRIGGAVLVAGFTSNLGYEDLESFFTTRINCEKIKGNCSKFVAIHSDNDYYVSLNYADIFKEKLGAEVVIKQNHKHFTGGDGYTELPCAFDAVIKVSK
ncbi:MAG: RBBP9/YdeN family alpha/beta hydrolase [Candidatus Nanoarchaeia archaeon]